MAEGVESIQSILRRRRGASFVGRAGQLALFRENFRLSATDPRKVFIFNVHGEGGVGKSTLLERWRQIARDLGALEALVDEHVFDAPEAMSALIDQLDFPSESKEFRTRYAEFLKSRERFEGDPEAPRELWSQIIRTGVKAGLHASKALPGAAPVVELVDGDAAADAVDHVRKFLAGKMRDSKEVRLLLSPTSELSPAFTETLSRISSHRSLVLFFDTFEQTGTFLEDWLLAVMSGEYGELAATVTIVIAGRLPLDANRWSDLLGLVAPVPLNPFTSAESRQLLAAQGITDNRTIETIMALSGGLPLLTDMLAKGRPLTSASVDDPMDTAVERFLKWESNPIRRRAALAGALPRLIDEDLLEAAMGAACGSDLFTWLTDQAFVRLNNNRYQYHQVVRSPMIRWQRQRSPKTWRESHSRLAAAYRVRRDLAGSAGSWSNTSWLESHVEVLYHELCARVITLGTVLDEAATAAAAGTAALRRWSETIADAARDTGDEDSDSLGRDLAEAAARDGDDIREVLAVVLKSGRQTAIARAATLVELARTNYQADRFEEAIENCTQALSGAPDCPDAYAVRAAAKGLLGRHSEALTDFSVAISLKSDDTWAISRRGEMYRRMGCHDEALDDFHRVIEIDPSYTWAVASRGHTYQQMKQYDDALRDCNRAVELEPDAAWIVAQRADTLREMKRCDDALGDFDRAIQLHPTYVWAIARRAETYQALKRYDDALADLDRAIELEPTYPWLLVLRGEVYQELKRYGDALADFDQALENEPTYVWAMAQRANTYQALKRYDDALADLDRAIELEPTYPWLLVQKAGIYQTLKRYGDAIANFNLALENEPTYVWAMAQRAETYQALKRYDDALADLDRAIELEPSRGWILVRRGEIYQELERHDEAMADFERAIELDPTDVWAVVQRAETYRDLKRYDDALASLAPAIEREPANGTLLAERAETYRLMKRYDDALADFNQALEKGPAYVWARARRAETYQALKRYDEAFADLDRAIELEPTHPWLLVLRGEIYQELKRHDEAMADFERAIELDPTDVWAVVQRAETYQDLKRYDDALASLAPAIEREPANGTLLAERAETYRLMKRYDDALADFNHALRIDPNYQWAIVRRGETYRLLKRYEEALEDLDHAIATEQANAKDFVFRGLTHRDALQTEKAAADFERAASLDPSLEWTIDGDMVIFY